MDNTGEQVSIDGEQEEPLTEYRIITFDEYLQVKLLDICAKYDVLPDRIDAEVLELKEIKYFEDWKKYLLKAVQSDLTEDLFSDLVEAVRWAIADNQIFRQTVEPLGFDYFGENADYPVLRLKDNGYLEKFRNSILEHCSPELKQVFEENETYPEYKPHITLKKIGEELPEEIELEYIQIWNEEEA